MHPGCWRQQCCFDLVNRSPFDCSLWAGWLHDVTINLLDIVVASYGALGQVPPHLPTIQFFQLTLEPHKV